MRFATLIFLTAVITPQLVQAEFLISGWTFQTNPASLVVNNSTTIGPIAADSGLLPGNASGVHASANTDWSSPTGNGSANALSTNTWAVGDYFQFEVSTLGYEGIKVSWDQTSSATGPGVFDFDYRVGNSGSFSTALDNYGVFPNQAASPGLGNWTAGTAISGYSTSVDLSGISAIDNQSTIQFRILMATTDDALPPGAVATGGTSRIDNFLVTAVTDLTAVPEPASLGGALTLFGAWVLRRRKKCE
jgi:hypothetical protein